MRSGVGHCPFVMVFVWFSCGSGPIDNVQEKQESLTIGSTNGGYVLITARSGIRVSRPTTLFG